MTYKVTLVPLKREDPPEILTIHADDVDLEDCQHDESQVRDCSCYFNFFSGEKTVAAIPFHRVNSIVGGL